MNEIKRKKYESPLTEMARVQLEDGICAASITDDQKHGVTVNSNAQDYESCDVSKDYNADGSDIIDWNVQQ